jgi:hypothetical protein
MDSPIVLFLLAVGKHWAEFLIGAVTIGAAVGAVVALVERYRQRSVSWRTYAEIFVIGGLLVGCYYAWLDQHELVAKRDDSIQALEGVIKQRDASIRTLQEASLDIPLGIKETTLTVKEHPPKIEATFQFQHYGTGTTIENIGSAMMIVFGTGEESQDVGATSSPSLRLNPQQTHTYVATIRPKDSKTPDPYLSLIKRKQPIEATLLLYFTVNGTQFSQREVYMYNYDDQKWQVEMEQQVKGFVSWPVGVFKGVPQYWAAPWLPPVPPGAACTPLSIK